MVLERQFRGTVLKKTLHFFRLSPTLSHLHPLQVENCDSNLRLVVDEDDNGKFRLESVLNNVSILVDTLKGHAQV